MAISIPPRKNVKARAIAAENPELSPAEVAKRVGLDRGATKKALSREVVGRDKPKSKRTE